MNFIQKTTLCFFLFLFFGTAANAQMKVGQDTLYGNEWINYTQKYYKIKSNTQGMVRITYADLLVALGTVDVQGRKGSDFRMFYMGKEVPLNISTGAGLISSLTYIEYYSRPQPVYIDQFLVSDTAKYWFSPNFSLSCDYQAASPYFLTWSSTAAGAPKRYTDTNNGMNGTLPIKENFYIAQGGSPWYAPNVAGGFTVKWSAGVEQAGEAQYGGFEARGFSRNSPKPNNGLNIADDALLTTFVYTGSDAPMAAVKTRIRLYERYTHNLNIYLNNIRYVQENSIGYNLKNYTFSVPAASLVASNTFKVEGLNTGIGSDGSVIHNDYFALANAVLRYPRQFNFENKTTYEFEIEASTTPKYIEITNFNHANLVPILYDQTNGLRIETALVGGIVKFVLPASATKRFLTLRSATGFVAALGSLGAQTLVPVSFVDYSKTTNQGDYIIISHKNLFNESGSNWVKEYAAYRSQTSGYDTLVVEMGQLYNQFAYGVEYHPISIRNFAWFSKRRFAETPKYIFMIGKGYWSPTVVTNSALSLVPGFGYPCSDNLMMAGTKSNIPAIPFGRLAATSGKEVKDYLSKVRESEATQTLPNTETNKAWMKKVIHLIGAENDPSIPVYMDGFKNTIEAPMYGGKVFTFIKTNTDPVNPITSVYLDSLIRTGCSIINMFGHAYANGTDYDLEPSRMDNKGKYPLVLSLGCFSGDMFAIDKNLSERFVLQQDRGSIGFMASVHLNTSYDLNRYASKFYRHIATDMYGKGIGDIVRQTIADDDLGNPIINQNLLYHGDPAVRLYPFAGPDYTIRDNSIRITPNIVTTIQDFFRVDFTGMNIGKSINDSINIKITRTFPQFGESTTIKRIKAPAFDKDYFFNLPVGTNDVYGTNAVTICMDASNEVNELPLPLAENNNCKRYEFQIYSNLVLPVYPSQFGIHNKNTVTLRAAATNPLGTPTSYTMEIDTTERFNSPLRRRTVVPNFSGGLLEWDTKTSTNNAQLVLRDSAVYYWRVKVTNDSLWQNSSFVYLNNEYEGWNQSHYYQYLKDQFFTVKLPDNSRKFDFIGNGVEFRVNSDMNNLQRTQVFMNGTAIVATYCGFGAEENGVVVHVIDPITGIPWENTKIGDNMGLHGSFYCSDKKQYGFVFHTNDSAGRGSVKRFLTQIVPTGHYVLLWSRKDMKAKYWRNDPVSLGDVIRQQSGATLLAQAELRSRDSASYGILYRKNTPSFTIKEVLKSNPIDVMVNEQFLVPGQLDRGSVNSTTVGPAIEWGSFHWKTKRTEATDVTSVDIYGIKNDNTEVLLMPNLRHANQTNTSNLSLSGAAGISAATYPRLRLVWKLKDTVSRTAPNLDYWRVLYKQIPEAVLRPEIFYSFESSTTVERGETIRMKIEVENITNTDMDSLRVKYAVTKPDGVVENKYIKFGKLLANTKLRTDFSYNTRNMNLAGDNTISIDVNPQDAQEQREQYHFNNIGTVRFKVNQDIKNPLLDVTFDGIHILDNDLVSSKPTILITLKDENKYLSLGDTTHFKIYLEEVSGLPTSNPRRQIYFNDNELRFYPADASNTARNNNKARVEYNPQFPKDGTFILYVQGSDVVGNESGTENFKIHFKISNKSAISQVLNYPNPFTTRTQFVFTLTGSEVPEAMTIQIFTVTGQLVRTITKAELGNIHVGLNRTEFAWDGTDQYGDRLANGVYLYRVMTKRSNGEAFELLNDSESSTKQVDSFFQNGYGKMYMMR